jgi:hypothetical protein
MEHKLLNDPDGIAAKWNIREADNLVRVVLFERPRHNLYYTSLERCARELGDGIWVHVPGSAHGHGNQFASAKARVNAFLNGEWESYLKDFKV